MWNEPRISGETFDESSFGMPNEIDSVSVVVPDIYSPVPLELTELPGYALTIPI